MLTACCYIADYEALRLRCIGLPLRMDAFSDPQAVARYVENPQRLVPGYADLQRMAELLLAERAPNDVQVLVLGAGGGLELTMEDHSESDFLSRVGISAIKTAMPIARNSN